MNFKKVMSGALALVAVSAVLTSTGIPVSAVTGVGAGDVTIAVGTVTAEAGADFEVKVSLANVPSSGLLGADFAIGFDSSKVTISSVSEGTIAKTGAGAAELALNSSLSDSSIPGGSYSALNYSIDADAISVAWMTGLTKSSDYWIKQDGEFLIIKGTVKSGATGTAEFTVKPVTRTANGSSNSTIGFASYNGSSWGLVGAQASNGGVKVGSVETTNYGDVNLDGNVTGADIIPFQAHFLNTKLKGQALKNADVTADGVVGVEDLATLKQFIMGDKVAGPLGTLR